MKSDRNATQHRRPLRLGVQLSERVDRARGDVSFNTFAINALTEHCERIEEGRNHGKVTPVRPLGPEAA